MILDNKYGRLIQDLGNGKFLTTDNKVRTVISRCPCCGVSDVLSHAVHTTMCISCGNAWQNFTVCKGRADKNRPVISDRVLKGLHAKATFWYDRYLQGFKVPTGVVETKIRLDAYFDSKQVVRPIAREYDVTCSRCGANMMTRKGTGPYICVVCVSMYERYKELRRNVETLTENEAIELRHMIRRYNTLLWRPDVETVLVRLKVREKQLGV